MSWNTEVHTVFAARCDMTWTGPITLIILFLVSHFNYLFIPCGRLSWLPVRFLLHVKYTLSYRIVCKRGLYRACIIIIINGDGGCKFWQPVQADSQPKSSGLVLGRRSLGAVLHSSNEPGELSQWLCHDDSTINIVLDIIIIIIIIIIPSCGMCVCLSRSYILSKRIKILSEIFYHRVATPF